MYILKEVSEKDLFGSSRYATVDFDGTSIELVIDKSIHYKKNWYEGDCITKEIINQREFISFMKEFHIKELPSGVFSEDNLKNMIDFMRS